MQTSFWKCEEFLISTDLLTHRQVNGDSAGYGYCYWMGCKHWTGEQYMEEEEKYKAINDIIAYYGC